MTRPKVLKLLGSPLLGAVGPHDVRLWLRAAIPARARVIWWPSEEPEETRQTAEMALESLQDLSGKVRLSGLEPSTRYSYAVELDGYRLEDEEWWFQTAPLPDQRGLLCMATGSCMKHKPGGLKVKVWKAIEEHRPDIFLGLGDIPYADRYLKPERKLFEAAREEYHGNPNPATARALARVEGYLQQIAPPLLALPWQQLRAESSFVELAAHTSMLFGWDDHDAGMNDASSDNPVLQTAMRTFWRFTANPRPATMGEAPGNYFKQRHGPVEIFMLDGITYRTPPVPDVPEDERTLLGAVQMRWVRESLSASDAIFKVLAIGGPWGPGSGKDTGWPVCRPEMHALIDFIFDQKIPGVILLGGDVHRSDVYRRMSLGTRARSPSESYPLYEVLSSSIHRKTKPEIPHEERLFGAGSDDKTERSLYATFDFDTREEGSESVTVRMFDAFEEHPELYSLKLNASELRGSDW